MNAELNVKPNPATDKPIKRQPRVVIIGAGMSGILSAIKVREAGCTDITVLEKADKVGGTWRENSYPGLSCDVPAHMYTYTFEGNPEYSKRFAMGPEIFDYFQRVSRKYGIEDMITFNTEIKESVYEDGCWTLTDQNGKTYKADIVLCATGVLHHPRWPDIEGLDTFEGPMWHTAQWDHSVDYAGKRVGIIGTGSTSVQIVSAITDKVEKLSLFQRTAQWVYPLFDREYNDKIKENMRKDPTIGQKVHRRYTALFNYTFPKLVAGNKIAQSIVSWLCKHNLESKVKDPVLREKLRPDYQAACKRLIIANGFYEAITRDNAELVTEGIECVESKGIRTSDGRLHELDILVIATGFHAHNFMRPMEMTGIDGVTLKQSWSAGAFAHKTLTVPGFPNMFMLTGPNSPIGNFSLININEHQINYITQLIRMWMANEVDEFEPKAELTKQYNEELQASMTGTVWMAGCKSWYFDEFGKLAMWPWPMEKFWDEMAAPKTEEFHMRKLDVIEDQAA